MNTVDIYVPALDREYDFQLDENTKIATIIEEIAEMIAQRERTEIIGIIGMLELAERNKQTFLNKEETLFDSDILTGSKLILV